MYLNRFLEISIQQILLLPIVEGPLATSICFISDVGLVNFLKILNNVLQKHS